MVRLIVFIVALALAAPASAQKFEELAQTPPMGWNSNTAAPLEVTLAARDTLVFILAPE